MVMFSRWTNFFQSSVVQCWWAHDNYIASVSCFLSSLPVWSSAAIAHLLPASQCSFMLFKLLFPSSNLINKATSLRTDAHCTFPPFRSVNPKDGCCPVIGWLTSCWKGVPNKVSGECICLVWCINVLGFTVRVACGMLNTRERLTVPAQVAAAAWPADGHTGRQTDRHWSCHFPCAFLAGGRVCAPLEESAAILKVTPHSGSDSAAVRNHDWRWRILLSWKDTPDSETGKRLLLLCLNMRISPMHTLTSALKPPKKLFFCFTVEN